VVQPQPLKPQSPADPLSFGDVVSAGPQPEHASAVSARARPRVALVNMPFASSRSPSIQLGLLQATLARHHIRSTTHYFNLRFGAHVGWEVFEIFCQQPPRLVGDWVFARAAFGNAAPGSRLYLDSYTSELEVFAARFGRGLDYLERLRERDAPSFVKECLDIVDWDQYEVRGRGIQLDLRPEHRGPRARPVAQVATPGVAHRFRGCQLRGWDGPRIPAGVPVD
jgi:hypothetical protein